MTIYSQRKEYTKPQIEVIVLENLTPLLSMSGQGPDTNGNHEFGMRSTPQRRDSEWDEIWNR